ncbi:MAG: non-heme iron oxygenase ferredoxin subunit [Thermoguttaceae bacterium]
MAEFHRVCKVSEIPDPGKAVFEVDERFIVLFHVEGAFYALDDCCTHDGGPLGEGTLEGFTIICPRHGAKFDIRGGRVLSMPAVADTPAHEVKLDRGDVLVRIRTA